ncbi:MAG: type III polyketide synthase [Pseudonocardiaceae bacterium]
MRVTGIGHAVPAPIGQRELWDGFFAGRYAGVRSAAQVFASAGVQTRHTVVNPAVEDISDWGTEARMRRYLAEALPLGKSAVGAALADAGLTAEDVGLFTVATCTGYATPGLDILLARDLGMPADLQRLLVGHMGCYAALPGLAAVTDFVAARGRPAVLLCLELTSLHLQPPTTGMDQVVTHALFGDAAAAVVVEPGDGPGLHLFDVTARTDAATADHMTWDVTDQGFRMGLSPRVPAVLGRHVGSVVDDLLASHGLRRCDVGGWAVHPGGRRIVVVVGRSLDLPDSAMESSYDVLRDYGNCSSPTVLLVLEALRAKEIATIVALAFGPGLTLYAGLLRAS